MSDLLKGLISEAEYCKQLDIAPRTAQRARQRGVAPPHIRLHRQIYYLVDETRQDFADRAIEPARRNRNHHRSKGFADETSPRLAPNARDLVPTP